MNNHFSLIFLSIFIIPTNSYSALEKRKYTELSSLIEDAHSDSHQIRNLKKYISNNDLNNFISTINTINNTEENNINNLKKIHKNLLKTCNRASRAERKHFIGYISLIGTQIMGLIFTFKPFFDQNEYQNISHSDLAARLIAGSSQLIGTAYCGYRLMTRTEYINDQVMLSHLAKKIVSLSEKIKEGV